ncbi:efflux RND transporter periplasmic adaptor subunit [Mesonia sp.]|uniref:efflux RND transporter periplasmic adaptor subunit n=1 Tax=Mesonia sp. TaxID=1960830 RepID=UPI0017566F01|nr:efflux RND transporter periplasmic adaptor subunit [Mesonia sp.]HIB37053.1 efflux RND transporter periplasmic adaptor subunit [Mesonia sp.]HIO27287.1 efflux RND transporter periplasmic adaptor subunit [Flavobacteriaceae bacterium]
MNKIFKHIGVIAGVFLLISCGDDKQAQQSAQAQQQALPYPVTTVTTKNVTGYKSYPTSIEGVVNSEVRAKVQGYIQEVLVDEGEKVAKGQALFKLETQSLSQDAAAAKANVNAAQVEVDKLKPLVDKDIISDVQLETAKAQLQQAKSNYQSIAANIGYATVKSPVDGYVGAINYRQGTLISPTDATPLTTVSDIEEVYAFFTMNESDYLDFIQNTEGKTLQEKAKNFPPVLLQLANGETYSEKGKIQTVTGQINANTGTASFRAIFENPNQLLTNGNSGTIKIPVNYENAVVVPQPSTYEQQGQILIYTLQNDNKVSASVLDVKDEVGNYYVVNGGIKEGDKIVAKGAGKLRDGAEITPQEVPFDSIAKPIEKVFK